MAVRVVDTDVWSYLYKGSFEAKLYEPHLFGNVLVISFQTQAELLRGVPLISHNRNHFLGVDGLTVISESCTS